MSPSHGATRKRRRKDETSSQQQETSEMLLKSSSTAFYSAFLPKQVPAGPTSSNDVLAADGDDWEVLQCLKEYLGLRTADSCDEAHPPHVAIGHHLRLALLQFVALYGSASSLEKVAANLVEDDGCRYLNRHGKYKLVWFPAQNAAMLVRRDATAVATVSVWEVQSKVADAMCCTEEVFATLPRAIVRVPWSTLQSKSAHELIAELMTKKRKEAVPRSKKAGEEWEEEREAISAEYVCSFLVASFGGVPVASSNHLSQAQDTSDWATYKKVRDQVTYSNGKLPWRRSPLWQAVKGAATLIASHLEAQPLVRYKQFVQGFLLFVLQASSGSADLSRSSLDHAVKKVVRRSLKVAKSLEDRDPSAFDPEIHHNERVLTLWLGETVEKVRKIRLERPWWKRCSEEVSAVVVDGPAEFRRHALDHCLPFSGEFLKQLDALSQEELEGKGSQPLEPVARASTSPLVRVSGGTSALFNMALDTELITAREKMQTDPSRVVLALFDTARRVREAWDTCAAQLSAEHAEGLFSLQCNFSRIGVEVFKDDPLNLSRVVLASVTMVLIIDQSACATHPLLSTHQLGVPIGFLQHLHIESEEEKRHLWFVEERIIMRNANAYGCVLEQYSPARPLANLNFGVRFARASPDMCAQLKQRRDQCRGMQKAKLSERANAFELYSRLLRVGESCRCTRFDTCEVCSDRNNAKNVKLCFHEKLLPEDEDLQYAVMYEENIPRLLELHRASLVNLGEQLCMGGCFEGVEIHGSWTDRTLISLKSSCKSTTSTHYARGMHVKDHETFICNNGKNLRLVMNRAQPEIRPVASWAWDITQHTNITLSDNSQYAALLNHFNKWSCNENEVHSIKCNADARLGLREFESAGTLRSGHRCQLHRLAIAIEERALSLDQPDVVTVIQRLLHQVGPRDEYHENWRREAHRILGEQPEFANDLCALGTSVLEESKCNWKSQNVLIVALALARSLLHHIPASESSAAAADAHAKVEELLVESREVAKKWIAELLTKIQECEDDALRQGFRKRVVDIAAMGTLSFVCGEQACRDEKGLQDWVYFRAVLNDYVSPLELTKPSWRRKHLYAAENVAHVMAADRSSFTGQRVQTALTAFLRQYWSGASHLQSNTDLSWTPGTLQCDDKVLETGWWSTRCDSGQDCAMVEIDVLGGGFLVDGLPCKSLPKSITGHAVYRRLFGDAMFLVQRVAGGKYRTTRKLRESHFVFAGALPASNDGVPGIYEEYSTHDGRPIKALLVPDDYFASPQTSVGDFPALLIENYSHWYVYGGFGDWPEANLREEDSTKPGNRNLHFRPRRYKDSTSPSRNRFVGDYILSPKCAGSTRELYEITKGSVQKIGRKMACLHSDPSRRLWSRVFQRMTPLQYTHIFVPNEPEGGGELKVEIELPLMQGLQSTLRPDSKIFLPEFKMYVRDRQDFGSLIGLQHGLVLESPTTDGSADLQFVCPHGRVSRNSYGKVSIDIGPTAVRSPPYFKYQLRDVLYDIHGPKDRKAWLFLALLHLMTSDILPDPFTRRTGLSRCLEILRSGRCCGNLLCAIVDANSDSVAQIFDAEVKILWEIAEVAFSRENYHGMEVNNAGQTEFEAHVAHDGLPFLVELRLKEILSELQLIGVSRGFDSITHVLEESRISGRVSGFAQRAYFRFRESYPKDTLLSLDEEAKAFGQNRNVFSRRIGMTTKGFPSRPNLVEVQRLAEFGQTPFEQTNPELHSMLPSLDAMAPVYDLLTARTITRLVGLRDVHGKWEVLSGAVSVLADNLARDQQLEADVVFDSHPGHLASHWLCLYEVARRVNGLGEKFRAFAFLLCCFADKFQTNELQHLHQLLVVALFSQNFPPAPDHEKYDRPSESTYEEAKILKLLEQHLAIFKEEYTSGRHFDDLSPSRIRALTEARTKRSCEHNRIRDRSKVELKSLIYDEFTAGQQVRSVQLRLEKVTGAAELANQVNAHFHRWRSAAELKSFARNVDAILQKVLGVYSVRLIVELQQNALAVFPRSRPAFQVDTDIWCRQWKCNAALLEAHTRMHSLSTLLSMKAGVDFQHADDEERVGGLGVPNDTKIENLVNLRKFLEHKPEYSKSASQLVNLKLHKSWELAQQDHSSGSRQRHGLAGLELREGLEQYHEKARARVESFTEIARESFTNSRLDSAGLHDAVTPFTIAQSFLLQPVRRPELEAEATKNLGLRLFCEALRELQRARRCLRLLAQEDAGRVYLEKELAECRADGAGTRWVVDAREQLRGIEGNDFLAFELDNDVWIRRVQGEVAAEMLSESEQNRLLQLNMGDGKTSVIMPIILCRSADGHRLVRGTVLSSLYPENTRDWQHKVGGMLGRRIYPMLCRRDLRITKQIAEQHVRRCEMIRRAGHFVVTVPEHRLSLVNKALESAALQHTENSDVGASMKLMELLRGMEQTGRDFLDESDELLSPKYQLVYTLGAPADMDGGVRRWVTHFAVIQSVGDHALAMQDIFGKDCVEVTATTGEARRAYEYPGVRLLSGERSVDAFRWLRQQVLSDLLSKPSDVHSSLRTSLTMEERVVFEQLAMDPQPPAQAQQAQLEDRARSLALMLRGILTHEVLRAVLEKRWRVQYGAHPTRIGYEMAVPYRGKDAAQEQTEFGHPDVGLSLTILHYYQQGLSETQLKEVFERLERLAEGEKKALYRQWADQVHKSADVEASRLLEGATSYEGVNLEDSDMFRRKLYPVFRRHMGCINFWLQRKVFPVQAKQFPSKLVATAGELCLDKKRNGVDAVTTGFSGTDDMACLLPMTVTQKNMPELETTNGRQIQALIRRENNEYRCLNGNLDGVSVARSNTESILELLGGQGRGRINVVLDSGALVLELSNEEFARQWLKRREDMHAAAFYDAVNKVQVLNRHGVVVPIDNSSFAEDMSACLLYLDDIHTRGSDFRLPINTRALLTLGKDLTKDKLLQTSMRMRMLGKGQSILFVAPKEVDLELRTLFMDVASGFDDHGQIRAIFSWSLANTMKRICDLFPYWAGQSASCLRKRNAIRLLDWTGGGDSSDGEDDASERAFEQLADACVMAEVTSLEQLYGHAKESTSLPELVRRLLRTAAGPRYNTRAEGRMVDSMLARVEEWAPRVMRPSSLNDEEQERELEAELEEELQIERPGPAQPHTPSICGGLRLWSTSGEFRKSDFLCAEAIFEQTTHTFLRQECAKISPERQLFITRDFAETVIGPFASKDAFIKRIRWFFSDDRRAVICSNYEAEAFERCMAEPNTPISAQSSARLFPFSAIVRVGQRERLLSMQRNLKHSSAMICLHLLAGSIHAPTDTVRDVFMPQMQVVLSVMPRPQNPAAAEEWDRLFMAGKIERDGFVRPEHFTEIFSSAVRAASPDVGESVGGLFSACPIKALQVFYSNSRHLGAELPTSPVGKLIGAGQLD